MGIVIDLLQNSPSFYYIGIKSVFIDSVGLPIDPSIWALDNQGNGGTVIDSGTTLTFLTEPAYRQVLTAFKKRVRLWRTADPSSSLKNSPIGDATAALVGDAAIALFTSM
uniref:Xylanase inhibitor C-terminal domain-containing protein n=1 Tax=Nelumbo nucifera TaxID=4432 RepID=A0A822YMV3_NELNU|nr:TPA_asm: hypothetical protein HUJ06_006144 [Nelumbo nucifera]